MSEKYSESDVDLLKSQNELIPWKQVKVIGMFESKNYRYQKHNAVLIIAWLFLTNTINRTIT